MSDKIQSKTPTDQYRDGWDRIFGKKKEEPVKEDPPLKKERKKKK
jgi:hypothetical protein